MTPEEQARQRYEAIANKRPGHKMPAWEGLPELQRQGYVNMLRTLDLLDKKEGLRGES